MKKIGRIFLALIGLVMVVPLSVFAIGSVTGSHSLNYNREGTWLCWMPNDRMSRECNLITSFVPVSKLDDVAPSARGYIRCRDGHFETGNIDIDGLFDIPKGEYIINLKSEWCKSHA